MNIEYEATFPDVDKDDVRERLRLSGALLVRPEYVQKRKTFHLPKEKRSENAWLRVRDEGNKITMSLKTVDGDTITDQKEICLSVNDFSFACELLGMIGCKEKSYQVTKRELWKLDGVEITIDEWPFLEPFIEVEGDSEESVKHVSEELGLNYSEALFCAVGTLYQRKYGVTLDEINNQTPRLDFDGPNPFAS
ncbi:MAG: CYTH domain-containing protein [Candidatus Moraniibacteriota bacterium]|nr:MAG: CYTH domain-containing protein [Candidatus Moranbacteria bacterium]